MRGQVAKQYRAAESKKKDFNKKGTIKGRKFLIF
jgi:hypothetical protein